VIEVVVILPMISEAGHCNAFCSARNRRSAIRSYLRFFLLHENFAEWRIDDDQPKRIITASCGIAN